MTRRLIAGTVTGAAIAGAGLLATASAGAATTLSLQGTLAGSYTSAQANPDTGKAYTVAGHGHTGLGSTKGHGNVQGPGNIASGRCTATLTLRTTKGTVHVSVTGTKTVKGFADCQSGFAFKWHASGGTGSYEGKSGSGTGTLTLVKKSNASSSPPPFYVTFDPEN